MNQILYFENLIFDALDKIRIAKSNQIQIRSIIIDSFIV